LFYIRGLELALLHSLH